jgi:hypothetical protein
MRSSARDTLRARFGFRCGYCGVREEDAGAELTVDHFQPVSRGGTDDPENHVYCCFTCNTHKSDIWAPDTPQRVLHPLHDDFGAHLRQRADGTLEGLTETGRFHIEHLHLNRPPLIAYRLEQTRREVLRQALEQAAQMQEELRLRVQRLEALLAEAERRLRSL